MTKEKINIQDFVNELRQNENSERTIKKYTREINQFLQYVKVEYKDELSSDKVLNYKDYLKSNYKVASTNNKIVIVNKFISFLFADDMDKAEKLKVKQLKVQTKNTLENVLSESDYQRLLRTAQKKGKIDMYYLMMTLANTGIRISELKYITLEAVQKGQTTIENKGKQRTIVISKSLAKDLKNYCKEANITSGIIFKSRNNKPLDEAYIYKQIQWISGQARVNKAKAHPHSFRHLFAKQFLTISDNVMALADILGHSSLNTTRIYTKTSSNEQRALIDKMYTRS